MSDHEPAGWINRVPTMQSGPGIHQIRLTNVGGRIGVSCECFRHVVGMAGSGGAIAIIDPGGDCWTPYRQHEQETTDDA